jgi:hypothetical protein
MLYVLYTLDIPDSTGLTVSTFADDTAILAVHASPISAARILQDYLISHHSRGMATPMENNGERTEILYCEIHAKE